MTPTRTYMDYNATAPLRCEARSAMIEALDLCGNASSVHADGRRARAVIEKARLQVAALVNAAASGVVFTSGATEANAWALAQGWDTIFVPETEHVSVIAAAMSSGARVVMIPVDAAGRVSAQLLSEALAVQQNMGRALFSVQMANSETGVMQGVIELAQTARAAGVSVHTDAVQAAGRVDVCFAALGVDLMSLSAHKMGGPKGAGALIVRDGVNLKSLLPGGGQERRRRGGTENIAAIAGFGACAEGAMRSLSSFAGVCALRDGMERHIAALTPHAVVIGRDAPRLANTTCVALPGTMAETLVIKLDLAGVSISAGSACSSGKVGTSHVLASMKIPEDLAAGAIRISIGLETTDEDIAAFLNAWSDVASRASKAA